MYMYIYIYIYLYDTHTQYTQCTILHYTTLYYTIIRYSESLRFGSLGERNGGRGSSLSCTSARGGVMYHAT